MKAPLSKIGVGVASWQVRSNNSSSGTPHNGRILQLDKHYSACSFICPPAEVHDGMTIVIVSATILSGIELDGIA